MESTTPAPPKWTEGGIFLENIESILAQGRQLYMPVRLDTWCASALAYSRGIGVSEVRKSSRVLLREAPYFDLIEQLSQVTGHDRESITSLRMIRKLFVIARDGIIVSTHKHQTEEFTSLRALCISLGRIADTDGTHSAPIQKAKEAAVRLLHAPEEMEEYAHEDELFQTKIDTMMDIPTLEYARHGKPVSAEQYHQARKDFRRVSNMFVLEAAATDSGHLKTFASKGIQLNRRHGDVADELDSKGH